jgi:hypothetical protein
MPMQYCSAVRLMGLVSLQLPPRLPLFSTCTCTCLHMLCSAYVRATTSTIPPAMHATNAHKQKGITSSLNGPQHSPYKAP